DCRRPASRWGRHKADREGRGSPSARRQAAHGECESLASAGRQRAAGWPFGFGEEHALPCHRGNLAVRAGRDSRVAEGPGALSSAAAVSAGGHAPQRGEVSYWVRWLGRCKGARVAEGGWALLQCTVP